MSSWSKEEESPQLLITTSWICLMLPPGPGWQSTQGEVTSPPPPAGTTSRHACVSATQVSVSYHSRSALSEGMRGAIHGPDL